MKIRLLAGLLLLTAFAACNSAAEKPDHIEVMGTAEQEVVPDIVYVGISLREYNREGGQKVGMNELEGRLKSAVKAAGMPDSALMINNVAGYQEYDRRRVRDFLASKQYRLKMTDINKLDGILNALDAKSIQHTQIEGYDYSKIDTFRKNLKIKALLAAKVKAEYLSEALGKKVGKAIAVSELSQDQSNGYYGGREMAQTVAVEQGMAANGSSVDFKKMKLIFQVRAVFVME